MTRPAFAASDTLAQARTLPAIGERALRLALRKTSAFTDARTGAHRAAEAALEYFDAHTRALRISTAERVRWRTHMCTLLRTFSGSPLCRRLRNLPARAVRVSRDKEVDLLVKTRNGQTYGVRFAFLQDPLDGARIARTALEERCDIAGVVIYDLERARARYIERLSDAGDAG